MTFITVGSMAPDFTLKNQAGVDVSLKDFKGKKNIVLYFYPKASTPGCTVQACGVRDAREQFNELNTVVLGISPDGPIKLQKFAAKYGLDFDLLADEEHAVAEQYGVWALKKFMGKEFMGIVRTSFIIDKTGRVTHVMGKVNTKSHDQDILALLQIGI